METFSIPERQEEASQNLLMQNAVEVALDLQKKRFDTQARIHEVTGASNTANLDYCWRPSTS